MPAYAKFGAPRPSRGRRVWRYFKTFLRAVLAFAGDGELMEL